MRIRVLSDLHLEFERPGPAPAGGEWRFSSGALPAVAADVVVLAGDISLGSEGVEWAARTFDGPVVYVAGNHEFYKGRVDEVLGAMHRAAEGTRVHVLDDRAAVIEAGGQAARFVGATLWTDFGLDARYLPWSVMAAAEHGMSDYSLIRIADERSAEPCLAAGERFLRAADTRLFHLASRSFLEQELARPFAGPTVVVTHMLPSARSLAARWGQHPLNGAFASHLDEVIEQHQPALWIHGHTHESLDYRLGPTRVVCNPRGYIPMEPNAAFQPDLVVEV